MTENGEKQTILLKSDPPVSDSMFQLLFFFILGVAAAMRIFHVGADEMWFDETISAVTAMGTVKDILAGTYSPKSPPLYYLLLHYWALVFGITETALRGLSAVLGVGLVAGVGWVGARLFSRAAGLCAMALAAVAPLGINYSMETRCYMLLAFLALWHIYFMILFAVRRGPGVWAGYILTGIALAYTHVWGLFLLPAANFLFSHKYDLRKDHWKISVAQGIIAVPAAWFWLDVTSTASLDMAGWVTEMWKKSDFWDLLAGTVGGLGAGGSYSKLIFRLYQPPAPVINIFAVLFFLALVILGLKVRTKGVESNDETRGAGVFCAFVTPLIAGYGVSIAWQPVYLFGRTDFIVAPFFYLLVGAGVARLNSKLLLVCFVIILFLASYNLSYFYTRKPFDAHRSTARYVMENAAPEDSVVCTGNTCFPLMYYLSRYGRPRDIIHFPSLEFSVRTGAEPENMLAVPDELTKQAEWVTGILLKESGDKGKIHITTDRKRFVEVNKYLIIAMEQHFEFVGIENQDSGIPIFVFMKE